MPEGRRAFFAGCHFGRLSASGASVPGGMGGVTRWRYYAFHGAWRRMLTLTGDQPMRPIHALDQANSASDIWSKFSVSPDFRRI